MNASSKITTASFSSKRPDSGLSHAERAADSYELREISFLPGVSIGAMNTSA
jgi:hypothetical protein